MSVSKQQAIEHNTQVVAMASSAVLESRVADPWKFLHDRKYAEDMILGFINSANAIRPSMGLPKLHLYNLNEFE